MLIVIDSPSGWLADRSSDRYEPEDNDEGESREEEQSADAVDDECVSVVTVHQAVDKPCNSDLEGGASGISQQSQRTDAEQPREGKKCVMNAEFKPLSPRILIERVGDDDEERQNAIKHTSNVIHPIIKTPIRIVRHGYIGRGRERGKEGHSGRGHLGSAPY